MALCQLSRPAHIAHITPTHVPTTIISSEVVPASTILVSILISVLLPIIDLVGNQTAREHTASKTEHTGAHGAHTAAAHATSTSHHASSAHHPSLLLWVAAAVAATHHGLLLHRVALLRITAHHLLLLRVATTVASLLLRWGSS